MAHVPKLRMVFTFLNGWEKIKSRIFYDIYVEIFMETRPHSFVLSVETGNRWHTKSKILVVGSIMGKVRQPLVQHHSLLTA